MTTLPTLSRRAFLQATGGLVIAFTIPGALRFARAQAPDAAALPPPNAFLRIGSDDTVEVLLSHSEMGQGVWTTLPMLIAEELDADWSTIRVAHAPAAPAYAHTAYGVQMTGGSSSTWSEFMRYRQAGALARALLVQAAAQKFGVAESECRTENGSVIAGNGSTARYGELAEAAAKLPTPKDVALKAPEQWKVIGKPHKRLDAREKTDGSAKFGLDVQFEGLLTAVVARAPAFGAQVKSVDAQRALAVPGVRKVVQVPSGVAVVADHFWAAKLGRDALAVVWEGGASSLDSAAMRASFGELAASEGSVAARTGDVGAGLSDPSRVLEAEYFVPYLAHAPMEPLNCTVKVADGACEIWTGTQFQGPDQAAAARILGIEPDKVTIHTMFLGGGFGRRATPSSDCVSEAVEVAKAAGSPVKTVWTREDDIRGGYYRPMYLHRARIARDADGNPGAWDHVIVGQSIAVGTPFEAMMVRGGVDATSVEGVADSPYLAAIGARRVHLHSPTPGIPVLWWRSVGHSHTAFVMESLIDELAAAAGVDPVEYRRRLLTKFPRHLGALELVARESGWGSKPVASRARGVAVHESFGSFVAQVAEVSVSDGAIRVHRVDCAIDCGIAVNPAGIVAQIESGIAFGLGAALHSALTFAGGKVLQSNFHDYRVLRLPEMPQVAVHIVPSRERPGGVGEPGVPPIAPAVANAVFALTRQRLRELPLRPAAAEDVS